MELNEWVREWEYANAWTYMHFWSCFRLTCIIMYFGCRISSVNKCRQQNSLWCHFISIEKKDLGYLRQKRIIWMPMVCCILRKKTLLETNCHSVLYFNRLHTSAQTAYVAVFWQGKGEGRRREKETRMHYDKWEFFFIFGKAINQFARTICIPTDFSILAASPMSRAAIASFADKPPVVDAWKTNTTHAFCISTQFLCVIVVPI